MCSLSRTLVFCGAALIGCGGAVTDGSGGQDRGNARGTGTDGGDAATTVVDSAPRGGSSGRHPSSLPDAAAADAASGTDAASDGGAVCPIQVSGTALTASDCYACLQPGARCVSAWPSILPPFTAADCAHINTTASAERCWWYADGAPVDALGQTVMTCESNPGRVVCTEWF